MTDRKLIGPAWAHQDAPCTDACYEPLQQPLIQVPPEVIAGFASGLGALKAKAELGQGCELTPQEVKGIIWGIKQLRAGASRSMPGTGGSTA